MQIIDHQPSQTPAQCICNSRYRQYERNTRMLRSSPIPGALWDRAVATLFPVWRLRVREMCIPRGPVIIQLALASGRGYRK